MMRYSLLVKRISSLVTTLTILGLPLIILAQQDNQDNQTKKLIAGHKVIGRIQNVYAKYVKQILEDRKGGQYWFETMMGLKSYDEIKNKGKEIRYRGDTWPGPLAQSSDGKIWKASIISQVGQLGALSICDEEGCRSLAEEEKRSMPISSNSRSSQDYIRAIFPAQDNRLWFFIGNRLLAYNNQRWEMVLTINLKDIPDTLTTGGLQDREGYIWLGGNHGIIRVDEHAQEYKLYPNPKYFERSDILYEDREGRIWFANSRGQICVHNKRENSWTTYILKDHLNVSPDNFTKRGVEGMADLTFGINGMCQDQSGQMFFATASGLVIFNEAEKQWSRLTRINNAVLGEQATAIMKDSLGRIWIGTDKGMIILAP